MPVARLNRNTLRVLCDTRLEEANVLLDRKLWTGAYYLTGLAIECALKSCLASAVKEYDFPDKEFVNQMYVHNLEKLFKLNGGLWSQLQVDMQMDARLYVNWNTVRDWDDSRRYDEVDEATAKSFHRAATEQTSGVVEWIRGKW